MKKKKKKKQYNYFRVISIIIIITLAFFTIGFSALSADININGIAAYIRVQRDIRITDFRSTNATYNGESSSEGFNYKNGYSNISLPSSNSTVTYRVEVTNIGNMEASISNISGLPINLTYSLSSYTLNDMLCDDLDSTQCKLGSVTTFFITIGYDENGYDGENTDYVLDMEFTFSYMVDAVAMMGSSFYDTLQEAIDDVPTDNTLSNITLLKNTSEVISILADKNIVLNLNNKTLSNDGNTNVISNYGTLVITNGTITSNAATNGAINNEITGVLTINSAQVLVTGGRQALYNNKGNATITGSSYLSASTNERATVQNQSGGTISIVSGTIISTGLYGVNNAGTLTIGVKDGNLDSTTPLIKAESNGIYATTNFKYYDGIIKSKTDAINNVSRVSEVETGYGLINTTEVIDGYTYNVVHLGVSRAVTFNPNGGSLSNNIRYVELNHAVGTLPIPDRSAYVFDGWYTSAKGGTQIDENTIITNTVTFYAHWIQTSDVAMIGNTLYATLQAAINTVPTDNTQTTIVVLKDTSENISIVANKNIILDLGGMTVSCSGDSPLVDNQGMLTVTNGTLYSNSTQSIINTSGGILTITNGARLIATGTKQAIYITGGITEINGDAYISSLTNGKPNNSTMERGTVHNVSGTLLITGGTIVGSKQQAVSNQSTLTIGVKDGNISNTTPVLIGKVNGVKSTGTFNFYDGIIKAETTTINGAITEREDNSQLVNSTETIDNKTYKTTYLESSQ